MCSPVGVDFSDEGHGDREIDEFAVGHADFERLGQSERRDFVYPKRKHLGLWHVLQGEKVDGTIVYTPRIELLRCGDGLKPFDHSNGARGILDLLALLLFLLVPFPDACHYRIQKDEGKGSNAGTCSYRLQGCLISNIIFGGPRFVDAHDHNGSSPYREVAA